MIIKKNSGNFRMLVSPFLMEKENFAPALFELDSSVREHPHFQKLDNGLYFFFKHVNGLSELFGSKAYVARKVIGPPLETGEEVPYKIADGLNFTYLSYAVDYEKFLEIEQLYFAYIEAMGNAKGLKLGEFWGLELDYTSQLKGEILMFGDEEKLFSQFKES